jgi:hypothetical protein
VPILLEVGMIGVGMKVVKLGAKKWKWHRSKISKKRIWVQDREREGGNPLKQCPWCQIFASKPYKESFKHSNQIAPNFSPDSCKEFFQIHLPERPMHTSTYQKDPQVPIPTPGKPTKISINTPKQLACFTTDHFPPTLPIWNLYSFLSFNNIL